MNTPKEIKNAIRDANFVNLEFSRGVAEVQLTHDQLPTINMATYVPYYGEIETRMWIDNEYHQRTNQHIEFTDIDKLSAFILGVLGVVEEEGVFTDEIEAIYKKGLEVNRNI